MNKKLMALFMAVLVSGTGLVGCASNDAKTDTNNTQASTETKQLGDDEYQYISASEVLNVKDSHVLDVREWENYVQGRVKNSDWCPIFPLEDTSLESKMKTYVTDKYKDGKKIYIVCNSGKRGAEKATKIMREAGIEPTNIYTVEGGAKELANVDGALTTDRTEENIDWQYVTGKEAVSAVDDSSIQILDVRDNETYASGHLKGSLQVNLKDTTNAEAQTELYNLANDKMDMSKKVYLVCYSGNKCAKTGISVLKDAGFDVKDLYIIKDGAKDSDVSGAFVTD